MIPEKLQNDLEILRVRGFNLKITEEGSNIYIEFKDFPLPPGFNMNKTDLLIFTTANYPNSGFDMFWTDKNLTLSNGGIPNAAGVIGSYLGKEWRQFSYHPYNANNPWNPSTEDVTIFIQYVQQRLQNGD